MPSFRFIHYCGRSAPLLMVTAFAGFISTNIWVERVGFGSFCALFILGVYGAFLGIKGIRGPLLMKCPFCAAKGRYSYSKNLGGYLECGPCGVVRGSGFFKARLVCGKLDATQTHEEQATMGPLSPVRTIRAAPRSFAAVFALPIITIFAASFIHRFLLFYLVIPGVWCFFTGVFLLQAIQRGVIEDNTVQASRDHGPVRFWMTVGIWSLAYLCAAAFPVFFALQEAAKSP